MESLFLETTAAAERIFGLPETMAFINSVCEGKTLLSSTYVWGEFRRTFLNDHIICHTVFVNSLERGEDLATALKRLPRFSELRYKPRKLRRAFDVVARLHEQPFDSLQEAVERLENEILYSLQISFFAGLRRPLLTGADCQMTPPLPLQAPETIAVKHPRFELISKCSKRDNPNCKIISFWRDHKADLKAIATMAVPRNVSKTSIDELNEFKKAAQAILENIDVKPSEAYGERCYAKIADLIISLECPPNVPIITSNRHHYYPLCETLSRPEPICFLS